MFAPNVTKFQNATLDDRGNLTLYQVRAFYIDLSGERSQYGSRQFGVEIDDEELAERLIADGWPLRENDGYSDDGAKTWSLWCRVWMPGTDSQGRSHAGTEVHKVTWNEAGVVTQDAVIPPEAYLQIDSLGRAGEIMCADVKVHHTQYHNDKYNKDVNRIDVRCVWFDTILDSRIAHYTAEEQAAIDNGNIDDENVPF